VPAKIALEDARGQVATLLGCGADEVVLTSGGEHDHSYRRVRFISRSALEKSVRLAQLFGEARNYVGSCPSLELAARHTVFGSSGRGDHSQQPAHVALDHPFVDAGRRVLKRDLAERPSRRRVEQHAQRVVRIGISAMVAPC